uniref:Patj homolog n=1 Tax=Mesocestoides corti TaxID=53468 RepID=A0A5K3F406_MESCO
MSDLNNGLGFGLLGNKTTGVLVRNIVPGGNADSVGNLRPGDLIMRVGDVSTRGMGPDQVARLLRQAMMTSFAHAASTSGETMVSHPASVSSFSTSHSTSSISAASTSVSGGLPVRLVVSRPAQGRPAALAEVYEEQNRQISQRQPLGPLCIVPTEALDEPLDHLTDLMLPQAPPTTTQAEVNTRPRVPSTATDTASEVPNSVTKTTDVHESSSSQEMQSELIQPPSLPPNDDDDNLSFDTTQAITPSTSITSPIVSVDEQSQPNEALESCVEFSVLLRKPPGGQNVGLGLIIVGYVSGDPDHHPVKDRSVTGIFVKDILPNGLASASGKIKPHDQIIKVNGVDLKTLSNKAAANLLKHSGPVVHLTFLRHTSGQVCEQLKQLVSPPTRPSRTCRALATLPFGLCRRPQKRRSRRNCETTAHPTYSANSLKPLAIYIPSNHQKPFGVCPAQSEILVAPELNSEESDDSICRVPRETAPVAGSWTCQSLPVLYANLREPSPSPTSCETEAILQSSTPSVFQGEQTTSSTAASLTLNSSPLEETDETEESTADTSSMHSRLNWTIGMIESVYLRAAVHFAGRAPPELIKLMVDVWTPIVGPNKEIMVIRTVRPKNMRVLGISLQGSTLLDASESTPDKLSEAAAEDDATATASPSRHFVHSVLPNSLFGQLGCLQRGDEILQVNGYRLHGYSHVEAVRCLRCLPSHIELVIARSLDAGHDEGQYFMEDVDGNTTLQVAASEIGSTLTGLEDGAGGSTRKDSGDWLGVSPVALPNQPPDLRVSEWIHRSHSDITSTKMMLNGSADLHEAPTSPPTSSMSLSAVSKADDSLLSLDNTRMSTLLRSMKVQRNRLDPSGATSMLLPGSDLKPTWSKVPLIVMLRRDTKGFGFSLSEFDDFAVSTTTVRTSSLRRRASTLTRRRTVAGDMNLTPDRVSTLPRSATAAGGTLSRPRRSVLLIDLIQPGGCVDRDGRLAVGDRLLFVNDRKLSKASLGEAATVLQNVPLGYTMIGVAKMKLVHATPQPPVESLSSPQFAALVSSDDKSLPLQAVGLLIKSVPCMVAGCTAVPPSNPPRPLYYRSAVITRGKHLWGDEGSPLSPSVDRVANQLVEEVLTLATLAHSESPSTSEFAWTYSNTSSTASSLDSLDVLPFVDDLLASALQILLETEIDSRAECLKHLPLPPRSSTLPVAPGVRLLASICDTPAPMAITEPHALEELDQAGDDDDEVDSFGSSESSTEESDFSKSSEDWLAGLEFVRDTGSDTEALRSWSQDEFAKEYAKDHPLDFYSPLTLHLDDMPYHASTLKVPGIDVNDETVVRVKTNGLPLGLELDALAAGGQDGCRVVKVLRGGAVEKAAALVPGDYITRINSDTLRCVSNAEAFRVLRKVSVECSTIEIAYYPAEKVLDHRAKHMKVGSLGVDSAPEASFNDASDSKASTSAIVSLIEDLPPPELILTTTPLLLEAPSAGACWTQTREIKLLKLPHEATWGIFITGPDMWGNNEDEAKLPPLPPEVSQPVFISKIGDDTAASRCGLLESGDIVIGVNGMDATRVGSRTVAEWLQTANFVSTSASSSSASDNESPQTAEWAFLYLLVLSFRSGTSSSSPSSGRRAVDLQSIPPVALFGDMTSSGGDFDCKSRPVSFLGHPGTLVRSAFISSNESSSMEEPTSVASLEQHGDIPEPLALSDLAITPPKGHDMPPLPANGTLDSSDGGFASLAYHHPVAPPIPSVQTVESQSAWRNIGSTKLTSSLAQLTETYRRPALVDDEIHVVTLSLAAARCGGSSTADCEATLGIRLVGHRDTNLRGVFVCSLREKSLADQTPGLQVTDEIVQVRESR